ncbi:WEB family protein At1g75720-like [Typha latifolia]|uniref:WEB family protein At1g75720-like n=1 Tax=Typha latifolia TaxID=4733 RepID=UPI003C2BB7F3
MECEENGIAIRRAEIDTSAPFRSVKEAVALFGERVLAGEVYANRLDEIRAAANRNENAISRLASLMSELEETQQCLQKEREENIKMADCLTALREELSKAKMELKQLRNREPEKKIIDVDIEDIKFIENDTTIEIERSSINQGTEFQKKRYVTFANPPSLTRVVNTEDRVLERQSSMEKEATTGRKKKKLIPSIGAFFTKKKGYQDGNSSKYNTY